MKNEDSFIQDAVGKGTEVDRDWGDYGFVLEITWSCEPLIVHSHSCRQYNFIIIGFVRKYPVTVCVWKRK